MGSDGRLHARAERLSLSLCVCVRVRARACVCVFDRVADYRGPFRYPFGSGESWAALDPPDWLFEPDERSFLEQVRSRLSRPNMMLAATTDASDEGERG